MWSSPCRPPWPTSPCRNKRAVFQILFRASAGRHHWLLLHPPYLGPICCFILTCIASSPAAAFRQRGTPGSPRAPTSSSVSGSYRASSAACFWRPSTTLTPKGISDSTADWPRTSHPIPRTLYPPGRPEQSALIGLLRCGRSSWQERHIVRYAKSARCGGFLRSHPGLGPPRQSLPTLRKQSGDALTLCCCPLPLITGPHCSRLPSPRSCICPSSGLPSETICYLAAPPGALSAGAPYSISTALVAPDFANAPPSNPHSSPYSQAV